MHSQMVPCEKLLGVFSARSVAAGRRHVSRGFRASQFKMEIHSTLNRQGSIRLPSLRGSIALHAPAADRLRRFTSTAPHAVATVQALVTRAAAYGDIPAHIACWCITDLFHVLVQGIFL